MKFLDLTLATAEQNLALDEAMLEEAEEGRQPTELLRLWESPRPMVVVGRSSRVACEVDVAACQQMQVPVLRRCSGGAAVVAGPGCLMYAVILSYEKRPCLRMLDQAHGFVLGVMRRAMETILEGVEIQGTSDLTRQGRKFSGNSVRCKRHHLLYHGTILYQFPLPLISQCLTAAPRQPAYRQQRSHDQFVDNFPAGRETLRQAIRQAWSAAELISEWPRERVEQLVAERYANESWNRRL